MSTDSVADALIRIKNGYLSQKVEVTLTYSKLVKSICDVLVKEGYLAESKEVADEKNEAIKKLQVVLRYNSAQGSSHNRRPALSDVRRISKPGLRVYKPNKSLPWVLNGLGIALISTPQGVMTDKQARKEKLGGEVMAYVW